MNASVIASQTILLIIQQNNIKIHGERIYKPIMSQDCSSRLAKQLISEPYQDWKDLLEDIKNHAFIAYHLNSMAQLNKFMGTMNNPGRSITVTISGKNEENRKWRKFDAYY